jgi:hypothetical protein
MNIKMNVIKSLKGFNTKIPAATGRQVTIAAFFAVILALTLSLTIKHEKQFELIPTSEVSHPTMGTSDMAQISHTVLHQNDSQSAVGTARPENYITNTKSLMKATVTSLGFITHVSGSNSTISDIDALFTNKNIVTKPSTTAYLTLEASQNTSTTTPTAANNFKLVVSSTNSNEYTLINSVGIRLYRPVTIRNGFIGSSGYYYTMKSENFTEILEVKSIDSAIYLLQIVTGGSSEYPFRIILMKQDSSKTTNLYSLGNFGLTSAGLYPPSVDSSSYNILTDLVTTRSVKQYLTVPSLDNESLVLGYFAKVSTAAPGAASTSAITNYVGFTSSISSTLYQVEQLNTGKGSNTGSFSPFPIHSLKSTYTVPSTGQPFYSIYLILNDNPGISQQYNLIDMNKVIGTQTVVIVGSRNFNNLSMQNQAKRTSSLTETLDLTATNVETGLYDRYGSFNFEGIVFFPLCTNNESTSGASVNLIMGGSSSKTSLTNNNTDANLTNVIDYSSEKTSLNQVYYQYTNSVFEPHYMYSLNSTNTWRT